MLRERDPLFPGEPFAETFESLVLHLKSRFAILTMSESIRRLRERALPARALNVTFDDGYADYLEVAAPILQRHGVPATVFVATGYLEGGTMFNDLVIEAFRSTPHASLDCTALGLPVYPLATVANRQAAIADVLGRLKYLPFAQRQSLAQDVTRMAGVASPASPMLTPASLRKLAQHGFEVGAHTVHHPILARLASEEAHAEIATSKRELETILDREVALFAYPNGAPDRDYTAEHVRMVKEAGFKAAVSTAWGAARPTSDLFQLPRFTPWSSRPWKFDLLMMRNLLRGPELRAA